MMQARDLYYSVGDTVILDGVSIKIELGKITTLIGPSGSGKTTLLKALSLLSPPQKGSLTIDDAEYVFPATNLTPPWPKVTTVFQQLFLWPHLTIRQNIFLPFEDKVSQQKIEKFDQLIKLFDMAGFVNRFPNEVSIGQRQRGALVRALMVEPKYLLLDEITSALDVEQIAVIMSHLKDLKSMGIGMLVVTHLLGFARHSSDHVVFLDNGAVIEEGPPALLDDPKNERVKKFVSVVSQAS